MNKRICQLINSKFYYGKLATVEMDSHNHFNSYPPDKGSEISIVRVVESEGSRVERTKSGSRRNNETCDRVIQVVGKLLRKRNKPKILIITPYRGQVNSIKASLFDREILSLPSTIVNDHVRVGTIHSFQGSEGDVVIWDIVDTMKSVGRLYKGEIGSRLINVAISRAKSKLIVVGEPEALLHGKGANSVDSKVQGLIQDLVDKWS